MKNPEQELCAEEGFVLRLRPRPTADVTLKIPQETLKDLQKTAVNFDMSTDALLKRYIGQGLRQDLARSYAERVMEKTAQVLARHFSSDAQVSAILQEIRREAA